MRCLRWLPLFGVGLWAVVLLTVEIIAQTDDRYKGGIALPYISDTGAIPPGYYVFSIGECRGRRAPSPHPQQEALAAHRVSPYFPAFSVHTPAQMHAHPCANANTLIVFLIASAGLRSDMSDYLTHARCNSV
uniref:Uncharacterized protein n=1 Tax=Chrysotila carterae TaxID=13221 RepID=A0A7S4BS03_CHRCT